MEKRSRTILWTITTFALAILFAAIPAAKVKAGPTSYGIWIGDQQFDSDHTRIYDKNGESGGGYAEYDNGDNTLTFHNFAGVDPKHLYNIGDEANPAYAQVYAKGKGTLNIKGNASLLNDEATYGIEVVGDFTDGMYILSDADIEVSGKCAVYSIGNLYVQGKLTATSRREGGSAVLASYISVYKGALVNATVYGGWGEAIRAYAAMDIVGEVNAAVIVEDDADLPASEKSQAIHMSSPVSTLTFSDGCKVTATAGGKNGVGIVSAGGMEIYECDITASGTYEAMSAGMISTYQDTYYRDSENIVLRDNQKEFVDSKGNPVKNIRFVDVQWYDIWVGNSRINSDNCYRIPGIRGGGSATFDPDKGVLTFNGVVSGVTGVKDNKSDEDNALLWIGQDMTIEGEAVLNSEAAYQAIRVAPNRTLTINGTITASGDVYGVSVDGNSKLVLNGSLQASAKETNYYAVKAGSIRISEEGSLEAGLNGNAPGISCINALVIDGGSLVAKNNGGGAAIAVSRDLVLNDGYVNAEGAGNTVAAVSVSGEAIVNGGVLEATTKSATDHSIHGNLTVNGGLVKAAATGDDSYAIYCDGEKHLTINGGTVEAKVTNNPGSGAAVYAQKLFMSGGTLTAASDYDGIYANSGLNLYGGKIVATGLNKDGIFSNNTMEISAGEIEASGKTYGINLKKKLTIDGGKILAKGDTAAIYVHVTDGIKLQGDAAISSPKNASIQSFTSPVVCTSVTIDGITYEKEVIIEGSEQYSLWIGNTRVTEGNATEIQGVLGGKASYDPMTHTLTFANVTGITGSAPTAPVQAQIYSLGDLTIDGTADLDADTECVIYMAGGSKLTMIGDLTLSSNQNYSVYASDLEIPGSLTASSKKETAVYVDGNLKVSGNLDATTESGTAAVQVKIGWADISGSVDVFTKDGTYGFYVTGGSADVSGQLTAEATSNCACYIKKALNLTGTADFKASGAEAALTVGGSGIISGMLNARANKAEAFIANGSIIVNGGKVTATSTEASGISSKDNLEINAGSVEATGATAAITVVGEIKCYNGSIILFPEDAGFSAGNMIVNGDGSEATHVLIGPAPKVVVTFDVGGIGSAPEKQSITGGRRATKPAKDPTAECKVFEGWYKDSQCLQEYDFADPVLSDITIYAKWKSGHDIKPVAKKDATCEEAGNDAYYICSKCGKWFSDAEGTKVIPDHNTMIHAALGHDWGEWKITKEATGDAEGQEMRVCSRDKNHTETRSIAKKTDAGTKDPAKGETVKDESSKGIYLVTSTEAGNLTVTYGGPQDETAAELVIPDQITICGKAYKVTEIKANAFKNNRKLKKITIGKNIKKIGKNAFYGCKNLKKITIKTKLLTKKSVGKNAFGKIHPKAQAKVPSKKKKAYKTILRAKGMKGKSQKVK